MSGRSGGIVYVVGAGPGDPRLITLRGAEVLRSADVVVYDRLASPALLDLAPDRAERVDAGKSPGDVALSQGEINAVLVDRALAGASVVRLKGGDPFVFGRGGEEALALAAAGVAFEVVPGVSAALAAPAYAGIPVTHRGIARSVVVVTATTADGEAAEAVRRAAIGADTVVVLMGAGRLAATCAILIDAGRQPGEPAAIVQWAATSEQRTLVGTLADLPGRAAAAGVRPPATLVVGEVVTLADAIAWVEEGGAEATGTRTGA